MHATKEPQRCGHARHGRGPSSYWMHDPGQVFAELKLKPGDCFLDLGCGPGDYSLQASKLVGDSGLVFALDKQQESMEQLKEKTAAQGCSYIHAMEANILAPLPLTNACVDVCFLCTVLHVPQVQKAGADLFKEVRRVLKPGGRLAIIECKKEDQQFGPPIHMRLSPEEIDEALDEHGFLRISLADLGLNYMVQYAVQ